MKRDVTAYRINMGLWDFSSKQNSTYCFVNKNNTLKTKSMITGKHIVTFLNNRW